MSQINGCDYCLAAHTAIGKMAGLDEEEIASIRRFSPGVERRRALVEFNHLNGTEVDFPEPATV